MAKPAASVVFNTSLSPVAHGVLGALAAREDPAHGAGNVVLTRLLREELDRTVPGVWDELVHLTDDPEGPPPPQPRDVSKLVAAELSRVLRARAER
jgi:hypothetical protein